jgi:hypothetical protein
MPTQRPRQPEQKRHPIAGAEPRRPSFRGLLRRNPEQPAERREHLPAGRRVGPLESKAFPSMSLLAPHGPIAHASCHHWPDTVGNIQKRAGKWHNFIGS